MHEDSYRAMERFHDKYCAENGLRVLDVGGADINGTNRPIFKHCIFESLDYDNADIIVKGYDWPIADETYDVVISSQTMEHDKFFWLTLTNIARVCKKGGLMCIISPSAGSVHRFPVDCYRFYPDAPAAFAEWMGVELVESYQCEINMFRDMVGIFRKGK